MISSNSTLFPSLYHYSNIYVEEILYVKYIEMPILATETKGH